MIAQQTYLTGEGYQRLEQELDYLSTVRRKQVARLLREAIEEGGNLLEDGALEIARNDQAFVEGRILELRSILRGAAIIDETVRPRDRVALGSRVAVVDAEGSLPEVYRIVGPAEADPLSGRISYASPMGGALLGHTVGDRVLVNAPDGEEVFQILEID